MPHVPPWLGATALAARPATGGGSPLLPAPFLFVNGPADGPTPGRYVGWAATWPGAPPSPLVALGTTMPFNALRPGYDRTGAAVVHTDTLYVNQGVRQPWPNQALSSADQAALSDYPYVSDTIVGAGNNSNLVSPLPTGNAVTLARLVVGDLLEGEYVVFHRNGRDRTAVPCILVTASDGINPPVSQLVTGTVVSPRATDLHAAIVWRYSINISSLANPGLVTANAQLFPWIGQAASINDSALVAVANRGFSPRYYRRDTARLNNPPIAYLDAAGNDATGVFSTAPGGNPALPFLTVAGLLNTVADAVRGTPATGGMVDGIEVRVRAGAFTLAGPTVSKTQQIAALTITRDPAVPRASAVVQLTASNMRTRFITGSLVPGATQALRFHDVTIQRTGIGTFLGEAANQLELLFDDVSFDNGSIASTWLNQSNDYFDGVTFTNLAGNVLAAATREHRMFRGANLDLNGNPMEGWLVIACDVDRPSALDFGTRTASRAIIAYNRFMRVPGTFLSLNTAAQDVEGAYVVQNLVEFVGAASNPAFRISGDSALGNMTNVGQWYNTVAGYWNWGRENTEYDETPGVFRFHQLQSRIGNWTPSRNMKNDVFAGVTLAEAGHIGDWGAYYGCGISYDMTGWADAGDGFPPSSDFGVANPGLGSIYGTVTSASANPNPNPLFVAPACVVFPGGVAAAGGGDYHLQIGSPNRGVVMDPRLTHDLDGNPRPASGDTVGCYV
jgi:hypothetical protein